MALSLQNLVSTLRHGADDVGAAVTGVGKPPAEAVAQQPRLMQQVQRPQMQPMAMAQRMPEPQVAGGQAPPQAPAPNLQGVPMQQASQPTTLSGPLEFHPAVGFHVKMR